jgi:uncharacterized protein (UPF0335 family)
MRPSVVPRHLTPGSPRAAMTISGLSHAWVKEIGRGVRTVGPCGAPGPALGHGSDPEQGAPRMDEITDPKPDSYRVTADELRQFIERWERLEAEKKDIADQQKEVMAEAKGRGYDTKVMRKVIALRKRDPTTSPRKRRCSRCTSRRSGCSDGGRGPPSGRKHRAFRAR